MARKLTPGDYFGTEWGDPVIRIKPDLRDAVVEAARVVTDACEGGNALKRDVALAALFLTIEALERAEKGKP